MTQSIRPAFNVFSDIDGTLLQNGYIYVGAPNTNPETNPYRSLIYHMINSPII